MVLVKKQKSSAPGIPHDKELFNMIRKALSESSLRSTDNLDWLSANMHPYFFITMREEIDAIVQLAFSLQEVPHNRKIILVDQPDKYIVARPDIPGSLYDTLKSLQEVRISYAELAHSFAPIPGDENGLEIQKFEFARKSCDEISCTPAPEIHLKIKKTISNSIKTLYPDFDMKEFGYSLCLLWINNENYIRISPPERVARIMWLYQQCRTHDGIYFDVEQIVDSGNHRESRILFSVMNPPPKKFMTQVSEVFKRLGISVRRSYTLNINSGANFYFLGTFYVITREGKSIERKSEMFLQLESELYNTQVLSIERSTYKDFVANGVMTGEEASLTNAFVAFCHTGLGHKQPDRFDLETVKSAFYSDPDAVLKLIHLFRTRFDPAVSKKKGLFEETLEEIKQFVDKYNTGLKYLDEIRKTIFRACIAFISNTLKTNFFIPEKQALAFRLDPCYMDEIGPEFSSDLTSDRPFRITFFFGRHGMGYHIGFSDIARGGWRTIICRTHDEFITNTITLFREVFVLAHTQHLKNKDIYEGGSKMTVVLDASDEDNSADAVNTRLHKLQYSFINAFLDIFVTDNGVARNPNVIDYYREDEPIELGPDENMHDDMIELIAQQAVRRNYILGIGVMSSKKAGINHKEYGVTSRGVIKFAEIGMKSLGINIYKDSFTVKMSGGTNGDVAGNAMALLLKGCPEVKILAIAAGSGGIYDPEGIDRDALMELVLKRNIIEFDPNALHPGGFLLFRRQTRKEGLQTLFRKLFKDGTVIDEQWLTTDEFQREFEDLIFTVKADLFLPCGGRPETIDIRNCMKLFAKDKSPTARLITEGANSFITPEARKKIQKKGIIVLKDASANKCGVISSSYEIIANLIMSEKEFLKYKKEYVSDVIDILEKRAGDEANLIIQRYNESNGDTLYTEISNSISNEINRLYANLFSFFLENEKLTENSLYKKILLNHFPAFVQENKRYRGRINKIPPKMRYAMLASEIATIIVYQGGWEENFEHRLTDYLKRKF